MTMWDDISFLHGTILAMASPLTQCVNGIPIRDNDWKAHKLVWADVFAMDWDGDLDILPPTPMSNLLFRQIKTRKMYERCLTHFGFEFKFANSFCNRYFDRKVILDYHQEDAIITVFDLHAAAMENMWLDELEEFFKYPVALAHAAVAGGHMKLLRLLVTKYRVKPNRIHYINSVCSYDFAIDIAARCGNLEMVQFLHEAGSRGCSKDAMDNASAGGHLDIVKYLFENRTEGCTPDALTSAICNGYMDVVEYLVNHYGDLLSYEMMEVATEYGNLEAVKFFREVRHMQCTDADIFHAIVSGHLDMVKYFYANYLEIFPKVGIDVVAELGFLGIVKFFHENGLGQTNDAEQDPAIYEGMDSNTYFRLSIPKGCTTVAMDSAAKGGHLDVVVFLHKNRSEGCTTDAMDGAAASGHFEIVKFLHENRSEGCTTDAMDGAAASGHFEIVKFLHENRSEGCTTDAMDGAAASGHFEIVQFLHENRTEGCTKDAMDKAASSGHLDIVRYLHHTRTEGCTKRACDAAARNGHFNVVQFLLEHRESEDNAMIRAGFRRKAALVQYLDEHGHCGFTRETIDLAASMGHIDTVRYLLEHRKEGFTFMAIFYAASKGYDAILKLLANHDPKGKLIKKALQKAMSERNRKATNKLKAL